MAGGSSNLLYRFPVVPVIITHWANLSFKMSVAQTPNVL